MEFVIRHVLHCAQAEDATQKDLDGSSPRFNSEEVAKRRRCPGSVEEEDQTRDETRGLDNLVPSSLSVSGETLALKLRRVSTAEASFTLITPVSNILQVHCVCCGRSSSGHEHHAEVAYYLDEPRLYLGDTRASPLRGKHELTGDWPKSLKKCMNDNRLSFAVVNQYNCEEFHDSVTSWIPELALKGVSAAVEGQYYRLPTHTDSAVPRSNGLVPSKRLETTLDQLCTWDPTLRHWRHGLMNPTLLMRRYLPKIRPLISQITDNGRSIVEKFTSYVEKLSEKAEAEALRTFESGLVSKELLPQLYQKDDIVVKFSMGRRPVAFQLTAGPVSGTTPLLLSCWTWKFDGVFYKHHTFLRVDWPADVSEDLISMKLLEYYPVRFDSSQQLMEKLTSRGSRLWNCRKPGVVDYLQPYPYGPQSPVVRLVS